MWILLFLLICAIQIRRNKVLRTSFYYILYILGLQIGRHIYTPVCDIYTDFRYFDIVFLGKHHGHVHGYRLFHREYFQIPLHYLPVDNNLVYQINEQPAEHLYLEGTPFHLNKGELILYQRKRRGLGFISEEIGRSPKWPFSH